ncbi:hemolysin family protein [Porcipelethomonas ammoniilytica]|jgi:putative hemolysin|uniref:hemolysin family protein n=1 Tax=Porcipelethomonas TaxID=2981643 RepID=UPI000822738D|nr:hemolysin family protein [Porcipelethomonas ammoniilytica]MBS6315455.1 HlyC/CorC family transporter [Ruminococcus sp.]MEE0186785.1 hemolysin family protein [Oscillospiraceae bacterium]OLA70029.1 MAG: hemolysin activation protein [Ruminococcus sp. 37_24]SCI57448.1 Putative Mg2+ and Co2+ transporter CorB [uncultured Ruminococcus sp.]MCU6718642.1 hemolysin family protein [Porcipelethomonas ammoniilytica]
MDSSIIPNIVIIIMLLVLSALFSSCETAFSSVNKIRLKNYAAKGDKRAEKALKIANKFEDALTAILIGNNIVNILSTSISTVLFTQILGPGGVGAATVVMTVLVLVFGEITPKSFAKNHAEQCALMFAEPLSAFMIVLKPVVMVFKVIQKLFKPKTEQPSVTEDELKYIIDEIEEQGVLEEQESDLVRSALEFDEITVDEILIPRVNVIAIEKNTPFNEIKEKFLTDMYSRLPVYEKNIDNIIGVITNKSFFRLMNENKENISDIIQEIIHISDLKLISEALKEMQKSKMHMAVVMDQYGGTKGIITLEDIIEELVGEIYDENDEIIAHFVKTGDNEYEVSGELSISDMLENLDMPEDKIECSGNSVGGWIMELLGHVAVENETVQSDIFKMTVLSMEDQKILKIRLEIVPKDTEENISDKE